MSVMAFDFYGEDDPNGTLLGTLDDADCATMEIRVALVELGSGRFTINRHSTALDSSLITEGNLVKVRIPSVQTAPLFAFWMREGDFTLIDDQGEGNEMLTFGGPGVLQVLGRARLLYTPYAPVPPASPYRGNSAAADGEWMWEAQEYGSILAREIEEGQNQPGLPLADVTITFDRTNDSDSVAWPSILHKWIEQIGTDVLSGFQRLRQAGNLIVIGNPDLSVDAHQSYGRDLSGSFGSGTVRFEKGINILTQLVHHQEAREALTHLLQQDAEGSYSEEVWGGYGVYSSDRGNWGYYEARETTDDTALNSIAANVMNNSQRSTEAIELEFTPGFDPTNGRYMPGPPGSSGHIWVGDDVTIHTGTGTGDYDEEDATVVALRIALATATDDTDSDSAARSLRTVAEFNYIEAVGGLNVPEPQLIPSGCCPTVVEFCGDPITLTPGLWAIHFLNGNADNTGESLAGAGNYLSAGSVFSMAIVHTSAATYTPPTAADVFYAIRLEDAPAANPDCGSA